MLTSRTAPTPDDEPLSDADRAAIDRALAEPGISLSADELAALLAAGGDDEVRDLIAAGRVAEAIGAARFNAAEAAFNWDEPRNRPRPADDGF
ncbi:MAG TPA: hypothetical protein PKD53_30795 [Chloroflexaceae bacterium]|nr:hypothetical protein [Chloroflexaceae bacterium]